MIIVKINVSGCKLSVEQPIITSGSVGSVIAKFSFDEQWRGLSKSAVFCTPRGEVLVPIFDDECKFPAEALDACSDIKFGVFGTDGEATLTSLYAKVRVDCGVSTDAKSAVNYTPGLYEQFAARFARFDNIRAVATSGESAKVMLIDDGEGITLQFVLPDGYTPKRGTDYWTDADKTEIKSYVDECILGGEW
ncbi:MAG: hypothetical protein IJA60_07925 [Clostridia bacterium]|nr:hypothetical protein [Clostridia bacterium]